MQTSSLELENLKTSIEETTHHTYLEKYIQKPVLDDEKLFMLTSIISSTSLTESRKKHYIIITMLVQIALDTHDLVTKTTETGESNGLKKERQLTVLAGDYYSGLYYYLLSEIEDYAMIHVLASAIKEINEIKMRIYYKEVESLREYVDLIKQVESLLILRVAEHVQSHALKSLTEEWLVTNKLLQEKAQFLNKASSPLFDSWHDQSSHIYPSFLGNIEEIIQERLLCLDELIEKLPLEQTNVKAHVANRINHHYSYKKN